MEKTTNYFLIFIGVIVLGAVLKTLAFFLRPLVIAIILTLLIAPSIKILQKKRLPSVITKNLVRASLLVLVVLSIFFFFWASKGIDVDVDYYQARVNEVIVEVNNKLICYYGTDLNLLNIIKTQKTSGK